MVHSHTVIKLICGPVIVLYFESQSSNDMLSMSKQSNRKGLKLTKKALSRPLKYGHFRA